MVKIKMSYKNANVEYVWACNYDDFNDKFKEKYNRDADEEDWNLFKEKFNAIRTDKISEWFDIDVTEIIDDNYDESDDSPFTCEGCYAKCIPDGDEVTCDACDKKHGCRECNGQWTIRERHFCDECNCGFGYDMFCCEMCAYHGDKNECLEIDIDGESLTFCRDRCHKEYVEHFRRSA